jgi:hypothetical protein
MRVSESKLLAKGVIELKIATDPDWKPHALSHEQRSPRACNTNSHPGPPACIQMDMPGISGASGESLHHNEPKLAEGSAGNV